MIFDKFPYTNFHELNLHYFLVHFKEIFAQWAELYDTMLSWKAATTAELAAWREEVESEIADWETNLIAALDEWKGQTEDDISDWETATLEALNAWKDAFETLFDTTFSNLSDIKTDAEAARDAAQLAQAAAEAAAASVSASAAQIATNANDIEDLQDNIITVSKVVDKGTALYCGWEVGGINLGTGNPMSLTTRIRTSGYIQKTVRYIKADSDHAEFALCAWLNGVYQGCWNGTALTTTSAWITHADLSAIGDYDYKISIRDANDSSADITIAYAGYLDIYTDIGKTVDETAKLAATNSATLETVFQEWGMVVNPGVHLTDLNDAIINRYYSVNGTGFTNQPVAEKGHLLTFGVNGGTSTVQSGREMQIFVTASGRMYYRYVEFRSAAPFSAWIPLAKVEDIPIPPVSSISMFQSIGVIGDSFASGEIYDADAGTHDDYYQLSWGQVLARMCGITAVNYSAGGLTTKSWLTNATYGLDKLNAETANNLYIIALGINDANHSDTIPVGNVADITSDDTASFYSYYGRIIRAIKTHAPNAIIMLSTLGRFTSLYNPYSAAVRNIGEYYDLAVLDLATNAYFKSSFYSTNMISNHPTAVNYSAMAKAYKEMIEKALDTNASDYSGYIG